MTTADPFIRENLPLEEQAAVDANRESRWQRIWKQKRSRQFLAILLVFLFVGVIILLAEIYSDLYAKKKASSPSPMLKVVAGCNHPIFCTGSLLKEVQEAKLFPDDKTFVDMPVCGANNTVQSVLSAFADIYSRKPAAPDNEAWKRQLSSFVSDHFCASGADVYSPGPPTDYVNGSFPARSQIKSKQLQAFSDAVHSIWTQLYKRFNTSGFCANCTSHIDVPYGFITAAKQRFDEFYYWDSFWIIRGLLHSRLFTTAKEMILNMFSCVSQFGFVPNGGRIYYTDRSQPPLLAWMVKEYVDATGDKAILKIALPILDKEHMWWINYRTRTEFNKNIMNSGSSPSSSSSPPLLLSQFFSEINSPRPEGYSVDVAHNAAAVQLGTMQDGQIYSQLRSVAESGMDFSSRWFRTASQLESVDAKNVLPVDLNAILLRNEQLLQSWFEDKDAWAGSVFSGSEAASSAAQYGQWAAARQSSMLRLMWSNETSTFSDYDVAQARIPANGNYNRYASASAALSIPSIAAEVAKMGKASAAATALKLLVAECGVKTSNVSAAVSGQQWDGNNVWAPMQFWAHESLAALGEAQEAANIASQWIKTTYCGWNNSANHVMFEKYNASGWGRSGSGGEYTLQVGFGWTNGMLLDWLVKYGASLTAPLQC